MAGTSAVFASGAAPSAEALRAAHERLLRDPTLQFSFAALRQPPRTDLPPWLATFLRELGRLVSAAAPYLGWIFLGALALAVVIVAAFFVRELVRTRWPELFRRRRPARPAPADWRPDGAVARALLDEADRLAGEGRYDEAARLILLRSIEDIEGRRPRLVRPALTAREIGRLPDIPEAARATFAHIAEVVERSFFGGRALDASAFAECRRAYEAFAFPGAWA